MEPLSDHTIDSAPLLPPDTKPLEHQIAGHFYGRSNSKYGLLEQNSTGLVLKPLIGSSCRHREHQFYLEAFSNDASSPLRNLRPFIPAFFGTYEFVNMTYLILENITKTFERPCIADVKIGRITYDSEASAEKKQRLANHFPAAAELGFQLLGWKTYRPADKKYIYHHKKCAWSIEKNELLSAIASFFGAPDIDYLSVIQAVLERLRGIEHIMKDIHGYTFIATSLLIIYDGNYTVSSTCSVPKVDVRLVDFAHVSLIPESAQNPINHSDENFLFGLRKFIEHLEYIVSSAFIYVPLEKLNHVDKTNNSLMCYVSHASYTL